MEWQQKGHACSYGDKKLSNHYFFMNFWLLEFILRWILLFVNKYKSKIWVRKVDKVTKDWKWNDFDIIIRKNWV